MKTLKERIEEELAIRSAISVAGSVTGLLREAHEALTVPVERELEAIAAYCETYASEYGSHHSRAADAIRAAGRRIAELEREITAAKKETHEIQAHYSDKLHQLVAERDLALERAKAAEASWTPFVLDGRTALGWKREAEEQCAARHDAEQEIGRLRSVLAKPRHSEPVPESRIEGRTHEQTHARLVDAERRCGDLQEKLRALPYAVCSCRTPDPAAPAKRKTAKQLRDDAGQGVDFLSESLRDDLRRAADLLDGGEGR